MNKMLMMVAALAVVIAVAGSMSQFRLGEGADSVFAQEHDGGGGGNGGHDAPPPDGGHDAPPPDGGHDAPPPDGGHDGPPPDGGHDGPPPDGGPGGPPPDGFDGGSKDGLDPNQPPPDGFDPSQPPDGFDGGSKDGFDPSQPHDSFIDPTEFSGKGDGPLTFEFLGDGSGLALFQGVVFDPATDLGAMREAGLFGDSGDPVVTGVGKPTDAVAGLFDSGTGKVFDPNQAPPEGGLDPGEFSKEFFSETFNPNEFQGDFGEFFDHQDFGKGELDEFFEPGDFKPDDFGTLFKPDDFNPGDFGKFAAVGDEFVDFGGHFEEFYGERGDQAKAATQFFGEFKPGEFQDFDKDALLGQVHDLDYQGFQDLGKDVVVELFQDGLAGQQFDLEGQQWAGAFSKFDVEDINGFDKGFIEDAVHDFSKADFLGIPDDQALALFETTFFDTEFDFAPVGAPEITELPGFDRDEFAGKLEEFSGQLDGFMGAFSKDQYDQIGGDLVKEMIGKVDFAGADFDPTVFTGEDVGHAFAAMDFVQIQGLGDKVHEALGKFESGEVSKWDPEAAFDVFSAGDFDQVKGLGQIDGLVGAMGHEFLGQIDGDQRVDLFQTLNLGGEDFENVAGTLDGRDIAGIMGGLGRSHLDQMGGQGILNAMQHIGNLEDLGVMGSNTAFDVLATVGMSELQGLEQFDGLVANFGSEQIQELAGQFGDVLDNLDFQANGALLGDFSFNALDTGLGNNFSFGVERELRLVDLANSVGGGRIFEIDPESLADLVGDVDPETYASFDPRALTGMFAGLDHNQITGLDSARAEAAIEAAGANFFDGIGEFDGIAGGDTAFDLLASVQDLGAVLEGFQADAVDVFGGNLFGN